MLRLLDIFFTFLHLALIFFNLFGWIWKKFRMAHFITLLLTAASWFVLGIWFGWGYCPITDWQWDIKRKLGETDLPSSFVKYFADEITGKDFSSTLINHITLWSLVLALALSIYFNFLYRGRHRGRS